MFQELQKSSIDFATMSGSSTIDEEFAVTYSSNFSSSVSTDATGTASPLVLPGSMLSTPCAKRKRQTKKKVLY